MADDSFLPGVPSPSDADLKAKLQSFADFATPYSQAANSIDDYIQDLRQIIQAAANPPQLSLSLMGRGLGSENFDNPDVIDRWEQKFPYRFVVLQAVAPASGTNTGSKTSYNQVAEYVLPINPGEITITTPFAIKTTITSRGVLEEHNGMPIKQIVMRGTTGWYYSRPSGPKTGNPSILGTIFAGTAQAIQGVQNQANSLISTISPQSTNAAQQPPNGDLVNTGYFQYHMLRLFLETYVEVKKQPGSQALRLALVMDKDSAAYLVTPQNFVTPRTAASPMEYPYAINMLAWGTVPQWGFATAQDQLGAKLNNSLNDLQRAFNALRQLRQTVSAAINVVSAVKADVNSNILGPLNQVILLLKDLTSIPATIADLPASLQQSLQNSVIANWNSLSAQLNSNGPALNTPGPGGSTPPGAPKLTQDILGTVNTQVQSMANENTGSNSFTGPANTSFIPAALNNINLTDSITVSQLATTPAQTLAISDAMNTALNTTNNDVNNLITNLQGLSTSLEPSISILDPLDPSWDLLYNISDSIGNLYSLMADGTLLNSQNDQSQSQDSASVATSAMAFWQQQADANNIPFTTPVGKFSVPLPYGATLEQLASQYLSDPTRWPEIVALNGLQYPYIDEDGFIYPFTDNGNLSQFTVSDATNLFVGQTIYLSSNTQISSPRLITRIEILTSSEILIDVNGPQNLDSFTTADGAQMLAYLPYTVNSMRQIYIPSPTPPNQNELNTTPITFINDDPNLVRFSRIDWLLSPSMDLAVSQNGFFNLAYGKSNLTQAAILKVQTRQGSLLLHPQFGIPINIGDSMADADPKAIADSLINLFKTDERFGTPQSVNITLANGAAIVNIVAMVNMGQNNILPIIIPLSEQ
jgi:hypothetical protein